MEEDLVCGGEGGGGDRGLEERRVRQGWRQQRGQKKKMNSGEPGSAGEAAEVSVEVSECTVCPFPLHTISQPKVRIQIREEAKPDQIKGRIL